MNDLELNKLDYNKIIPSNTSDIISTRMASYSKEIKSKIERYKTIVITAETKTGCKNVSKELSRLIREINTDRKNAKAILTVPARVLDDESKKIIEMINSVKIPLDAELEKFAEQDRIKKMDMSLAIIIKLTTKKNDFVKEHVSLQEWYAKVSTTKKSITEDIKTQIKSAEDLLVEMDNKQESFIAFLDVQNMRLDKKLTVDDFNFDFETEPLPVIMKAVSEKANDWVAVEENAKLIASKKQTKEEEIKPTPKKKKGKKELSSEIDDLFLDNESEAFDEQVKSYTCDLELTGSKHSKLIDWLESNDIEYKFSEIDAF